MQPSIINKLSLLQNRHQEIADLLSLPETINDQNRYRELSKEYATLDSIVAAFTQYNLNQQEITNTKTMLQEEKDTDLKELASEDLSNLQEKHEKLIEKLQFLLLPHDPNDERNVFLEIRAGAGGDEAAIFAGDLFRMYSHYVEDAGWQLELINSSVGEHGGYKEIIARIIGKGAYSKLKFESGVHRVQRVPDTEAQGRIHTSTCTVAVIAEADEIDNVEINPADLKIDTYRSSGAGGQHVNTTDSAIRITHLPSGVVVECQDERSQHKNRARAMSLLKARILAKEQEKQEKEQAATRRGMVGTGDRSERIRTYNFPQGRLTDHRINLTLYQLDKIMNGAIEPVIEPLIREYNAEQLADLSGT
ncbi:MAG: peptide chain release factor 1 [Gammaproteobacteria bacterium]|nr:peptide chain release factor 1 [Gammaproteobacteria bacterium]